MRFANRMSREQIKEPEAGGNSTWKYSGSIFNAHKIYVGASIRRLYSATIQHIHHHPAQSIVLIYIFVLSCSCINNVLCDLEPRPDNNIVDDDDDDATRLVSSFSIYFGSIPGLRSVNAIDIRIDYIHAMLSRDLFLLFVNSRR